MTKQPLYLTAACAGVLLFIAPQVHLFAAADDVRPDEIQFRRQAVVRMVFDSDQYIPLSPLRPTKVVDFDLMHPERLPRSGVKWDVKNPSLLGSALQADGSSLRWVGGFNPFATHDLVIENAKGDGTVGMAFLHSTNGDSLTAGLQFKAGKPESVTWNVLVGGKQVAEEKWPVQAGTAMSDLTLRAQMSAVSDQWARGFTRLAGPVEMDSTGTMIQKFGTQRFALFGSADRKIYIRTYPNLDPAGELKVDLPPWNDWNGTRIWPNVISLPEGFPAPYIALIMDRVNFPGMPKSNWTYGALYLYHGYPTKP